MKISINQNLIHRNKLISQIMLYLAIGLIVVGLILSFTNLNKASVFLSYLVLLPAYIFMQINIYMANKWGKNPRVDEIITNALKGLDNRYSLFHYTTDIPHLLIGPAGIWVIKPYHQYGTITYDAQKKKYTQKGGGNFLSKFLAMDSIPDIGRETQAQISGVEIFFKKAGIKNYPKPLVVNVFYRKDALLQTQNAPHLIIKIDKLKDIIRHAAKTNPLPEKMLGKLNDSLPIAE